MKHWIKNLLYGWQFSQLIYTVRYTSECMTTYQQNLKEIHFVTPHFEKRDAFCELRPAWRTVLKVDKLEVTHPQNFVVLRGIFTFVDNLLTGLPRRAEKTRRLPGNACKLLWCLVTFCELLYFAVCFGTFFWYFMVLSKVENFQDKGQAGKNKCAVDITAAIASAGIAASLITISALARCYRCYQHCSGGNPMDCRLCRLGRDFNTFYRSRKQSLLVESLQGFIRSTLGIGWSLNPFQHCEKSLWEVSVRSLCLSVSMREGVINCPASLEFTEIMGKRFCAASIIDLVVATSYIGTPQTQTETRRHETRRHETRDTRHNLKYTRYIQISIALGSQADHRYRRYIGDIGIYSRYIGDILEMYWRC